VLPDAEVSASSDELTGTDQSCSDSSNCLLAGVLGAEKVKLDAAGRSKQRSMGRDLRAKVDRYTVLF